MAKIEDFDQKGCPKVVISPLSGHFLDQILDTFKAEYEAIRAQKGSNLGGPKNGFFGLFYQKSSRLLSTFSQKLKYFDRF